MILSPPCLPVSPNSSTVGQSRRSFERMARLMMAMATALSLCSTIAIAGADVLAPADTSATADGASSLISATPKSTPLKKSRRTAFLCSFLTTGILGGAAVIVRESTGDQDHQSAVGTAATLGVAAYLAGPSIGHFYSGQSRRAWFGIGLRGLIGLGFTATLVTLIDEGSQNDQGALSVALLAVGAGAVVADIVTAPRSASIHNEKVRRMSISTALVGGAPGIRVNLGL